MKTTVQKIAKVETKLAKLQAEVDKTAANYPIVPEVVNPLSKAANTAA